MKGNFLGNRGIQLGATILGFVSMLSVLAWVIRTDFYPIGGQVKEIAFSIITITKRKSVLSRISKTFFARHSSLCSVFLNNIVY